MKRQFTKIFMLAVTAMIVLAACRKEDAPLPDNLVQFTSPSQGMDFATASVTVKLVLSRATDKDIAVSVNLAATGATYGTDFTTTPAAVSNVVPITILSGASEATLTITKVPGAAFDGTEKIVFNVASSASPVIIGTAKEFTLSFSEIISTGSATVGNGGGATYGNKVFFDLSNNSQEGVLRTKWDLGFYGGDDWRVIINSSTAMMAKQIAKNDLAAVTAADTIGFSTDVMFNQTAPSITALPYIDYPNGDLTRTAIAAVSATAADNKVYIVNRGVGVGSPAPARGWKKIRVIRNTAGGYTLQHADINSTTFTSVDIPKTTTHFFKYASFENGVVDVEPAKEKWDLAWTYFSNVTNFGTGEVPYLFQDVVLINRNVQIAKVLVATKAYAAFTEADITGLTFKTEQNAIASDWRAGGGPGSAPSVHADRYYIVKDGAGNYYKLRFTALTQAGERGYPAFEYVLVKKG